METNNVVAAKSSWRKLLPLLLVAVMAIAVFAVVWTARAERSCCVDEYCCMQPLAVEKQLEPGVEATPGVKFTFKMTLSPEAYNLEESVLDDVTHVHGIIYNADGSIACKQNGEHSVIPATFKLEKDHSFTFELEAGQFIVFNTPEGLSVDYAAGDAAAGLSGRCWNPSCLLPFEWTGGTYILNEIIDGEAASKGYSYHGMVMKTSDGEFTFDRFTPIPKVASSAVIKRWNEYFGGSYFTEPTREWVDAYYSGGDFQYPELVKDAEGKLYTVKDIGTCVFKGFELDENYEQVSDESVEIEVNAGSGHKFGYKPNWNGNTGYDALLWFDTLCIYDYFDNDPWPCEGVFSYEQRYDYPLYRDYVEKEYKSPTDTQDGSLGGYVTKQSFIVDKLITDSGNYGRVPENYQWGKWVTASKPTWMQIAYVNPSYIKDLEGAVHKVERVSWESGENDENFHRVFEFIFFDTEDHLWWHYEKLSEDAVSEYGYPLPDEEGDFGTEDPALIWWTKDKSTFYRYGDEAGRYVNAYTENPMYVLPETGEWESAEGLELAENPDTESRLPVLGVMAFPTKWMPMPPTIVVSNDGPPVPVYRPMSFTKEIVADPGKEFVKDETTVFNFELTVSPGFNNDTDPLYAGRPISGIITDNAGNDELVRLSFDSNHKIKFSLKANERITFSEVPFAPADKEGTYIIKECSFDAQASDDNNVSYTLESNNGISANAGTCKVVEPDNPRFEAGILGTAEGTLGNEGMTTVTVTNKQGTPPPPPPPTPDDTDKTATVTISKSLEGAANDHTKFSFEVIVSPEWCSLGYFIGTNAEPVSITGTIYSKSNGEPVDSEQSNSYPMANNIIKGIELEADQYIILENVPYKSVGDDPGKIIVNELLLGEVAKSYELKDYDVVEREGKKLSFEQADTKDKIADSNSFVSSLIAPANATEQTATGIYGEFANDESVGDVFSVEFTNEKLDEEPNEEPVPEPGTHALTITKKLADFDFDKYESANVAFNVYRFDTEDACKDFIRTGNATTAKWRGMLAMRLTANGTQSTELTGLDAGFYAVEELAATNMKTVGVDVARQYVQIKADAEEDAQFVVTFANSFDDQNVHENSIVNSYKKEIDGNGKITWKRYKNGVPVTE